MTDLVALVKEERARGPFAKEGHFVGRGAMLAHFLVAQVGMPLTEVPGEFWTVADGAAVVPCPCGATVVLEEGRTIFDATLDCERAYIYDGEQVYCINSPKGKPQATSAEPGVDVPEEPDGL